MANLLYLSRTWYASANRDMNYSAMGKALAFAQKVRRVKAGADSRLYIFILATGRSYLI